MWGRDTGRVRAQRAASAMSAPQNLEPPQEAQGHSSKGAAMEGDHRAHRCFRSTLAQDCAAAQALVQGCQATSLYSGKEGGCECQ